ncbi:MAG: prolyl oligopeptidase family serine peptidase [Planctomycetaceae bacterium]|nr:prolyl oligopeptidase family serine peptidase [Planctomycetaceae bacterium]
MFSTRVIAIGIAFTSILMANLAAAQAPPEQPAQARGARRAEAVLKDLARREWKVGETAREALLYAPAAAISTPAPVVFAFHGHGGTMQRAAVMFHYHDVWPEAIVVYMQGLNTPGRLTDPEGRRPGWQLGPGAQGDRDLKFFDAVLATLKSDYRVDESRIYATGHSNGGGFTYLLWRTRGEVFAAMAPSAAAGPGAEWNKRLADLAPKPVLHLAGEKDPLVKYEWQQAAMETLRKLNGCEPAGSEWAKWCTLYPSKTGTPVVTLIHPGAHNFPPEAPALFVKFFKEHTKK